MKTYNVTFTCEFTKQQYEAFYQTETAQEAVDLCRKFHGPETTAVDIRIDRVQAIIPATDWK